MNVRIAVPAAFAPLLMRELIALPAEAALALRTLKAFSAVRDAAIVFLSAARWPVMLEIVCRSPELSVPNGFLLNATAPLRIARIFAANVPAAASWALVAALLRNLPCASRA